MVGAFDETKVAIEGAVCLACSPSDCGDQNGKVTLVIMAESTLSLR